MHLNQKQWNRQKVATGTIIHSHMDLKNWENAYKDSTEDFKTFFTRTVTIVEAYLARGEPNQKFMLSRPWSELITMYQAPTTSCLSIHLLI